MIMALPSFAASFRARASEQGALAWRDTYQAFAYGRGYYASAFSTNPALLRRTLKAGNFARFPAARIVVPSKIPMERQFGSL
jgi:hypothetical protein